MEEVTGFTANMTGLTNQLKIYVDKTETVPQNCRAGHTFFVSLFFNKLVTIIFGTKCNMFNKRKYLSFCISSANTAVQLLDCTDLLVIYSEAPKRQSHIKQRQLCHSPQSASGPQGPLSRQRLTGHSLSGSVSLVLKWH